jgi:SAM-dependent methyltransferase
MENFTFVPKQKMWYDDLCEYYNVSPQQALQLGTRAKGRKPGLPGSRTCEPVSDMTWEELWDAKPRETLEQRFAFLKDIGSWQAFRQCVYRKDFPYEQIIRFCPAGSSVLEYGCGVAPLTNSFVEMYGDDHQYKFSLVEVECEHYEFAKWRLNKKAPKTEFKFYEPTHEKPTPDFGDNTFDLVVIMDVLEHLPNPYDVMKEIMTRLNDGAILVDTWIDHDHGEIGYGDTQEAFDQRDETIAMMKKGLRLMSPPGEIIKVWRKEDV